ncbi:T9SS type A sorting domain-containing protein [Crocinitomix catalasitica]|uniref:T9SS type A sorting domain-containing protein n=1 Tax=Crocinitomix catalasitica TaxID=184607 RepID=UPI000486EA2C|nr:T9SS type A sorting domain-containing protein [Crocinitomix catalasitica]
MKKFFLFFSSILLLFTGFSNNLLAHTTIQPNEWQSAFTHLATVNQEWVKQHKSHTTKAISFTTDADRIQYHLNAVIADLRKNYNSNFNKTQLQNRWELLDELERYADAKLFPENMAYAHRQPCFVDAKNTHCAVGYMMEVSGNSDLVARINATHQYDYIADIKTAGVHEWANEFGFTVDELAWIQPGYPPAESYDTIHNGTNGSVKMMVKYIGPDDFIFSGDFTDVDDLPCLNIGKYEDGILSCLGEGISGMVSGLFYTVDDGIYVYGELIHDDISYPMARYQDGDWFYETIPTRSGAISSTGKIAYGSNQIYLAISHPDIPGQEIWLLNDAGEWTKSAEIDGHIYTAEQTSLGHLFAGSFNAATTYDDEGIASTHIVKNILYNSVLSGWNAINEPTVSDTIKCVKSIGSSIYFGGSANRDTESNVCLSRYFAETMLPLVTLDEFFDEDYVSFNDIEFYDDVNLVLGGDFRYGGFGGTHGRNLAYYHLIYDRFNPIAEFLGTVHSLLALNVNLYIGGDFRSNGISLTNYNHMAKLKPATVGLDDLDSDSKMIAYPNPFKDKIRLTNIEEGSNYSLINNLGQMVRQGQVTDQTIDNLDGLAHGHYVLKIEQEDKIYTNIVVK